MTENAGGLFRQKTIDKMSSHDGLTDYLKVTSPSVWAVLAAVISGIRKIRLAGAEKRMFATTYGRCPWACTPSSPRGREAYRAVRSSG